MPAAIGAECEQPGGVLGELLVGHGERQEQRPCQRKYAIALATSLSRMAVLPALAVRCAVDADPRARAAGRSASAAAAADEADHEHRLRSRGGHPAAGRAGAVGDRPPRRRDVHRGASRAAAPRSSRRASGWSRRHRARRWSRPPRCAIASARSRSWCRRSPPWIRPSARSSCSSPGLIGASGADLGAVILADGEGYTVAAARDRDGAPLERCARSCSPTRSCATCSAPASACSSTTSPRTAATRAIPSVTALRLGSRAVPADAARRPHARRGVPRAPRSRRDRRPDARRAAHPRRASRCRSSRSSGACADRPARDENASASRAPVAAAARADPARRRRPICRRCCTGRRAPARSWSRARCTRASARARQADDRDQLRVGRADAARCRAVRLSQGRVHRRDGGSRRA